jgi:hypothetical protein
MSKHIINLTTQLTSKPAAKPEPETTSPKKEISPKMDYTLKKDIFLKEDTSKYIDEDKADL